MRRHTLTLAGLLLAAGVGCQADKPNLACTFPEEYTLPPDEARFNNPPESSYRRPPPKKEAARPGPGGMGNSSMGMGRPGMGGGGPGGY